MAEILTEVSLERLFYQCTHNANRDGYIFFKSPDRRREFFRRYDVQLQELAGEYRDVETDTRIYYLDYGNVISVGCVSEITVTNDYMEYTGYDVPFISRVEFVATPEVLIDHGLIEIDTVQAKRKQEATINERIQDLFY